MFAALTLERDLSSGWDPGPLLSWIQVAGGFAAFALVIWGLVYGLNRPRRRAGVPLPAWVARSFLAAVAVAAVAYAILGAIKLPEVARSYFSSVTKPASPLSQPTLTTTTPLQFWLLTLGGAAALVAVLLPFAANVLRLSPFSGRRVWALTRLTFQEAIRRKVLLVLFPLLVVFLFPANWWFAIKAENEISTSVRVVFPTMMVILWLTFALLASFGMPTDVRNQTIHTVVTKPVERFEMVLGRFLGYTLLMSLMLGIMTVCSLFFIMATDISPEAAEESFKARVPLYGDLRFQGPRDEAKGENVGREWEYRGYISGPMPGQAKQYALFSFKELPRSLETSKPVQCEFTFDIYRTTKGKEGEGVTCTFTVVSWRCPVDREGLPLALRDYESERGALVKQGVSDADIADRLAAKYGFFENRSVPVVDYHTGYLQVPGSLFKHAQESDPQRQEELKQRGQTAPPLLVRVRCESQTQYLGMAKGDLYFRLDNPDSGADRWRFAQNFAKGSMGLWFRLCMTIGLAVAFSTRLSGVISFLVVLVFFTLGLFRDFLKTVAEGSNFGGGPFEAFYRQVTREAGPLDQSAAVRVGLTSDDVYRWLLRRFFEVVPDLDRHDLKSHVAEGFDIPLQQVVFSFDSNLLYLLGYLIPVMVLAYYMLRGREIAAPT